MNDKLGISGKIAAAFQASQITPLLALLGLLLGVIAIVVTPREEEPQINVTFANIFIAFPGASAKEVEQLVSTPAEQILSELEGVKHIYSVSYPGQSILTVQFKVGEDRTAAIVRLYNAFYSKQDWLPRGVGVSRPVIKPKGIDDVPVVTLTLWSKDKHHSSYTLGKVAHALEAELKRVKGTRDIYTIGAPEQVARILLSPASLAAYDLTFAEVRKALQASNTSSDAGRLLAGNREIKVQAGKFLSTPDSLKDLVIAVHNGKPVYLRDVATIEDGPEQPAHYTLYAEGTAKTGRATTPAYPAVTLVIAKQPGVNASTLADRVIARVNHLKGVYIPDAVNLTVTRNYGKTANDKAQKLMTKLVFVTLSVVLLVLIALGWREAGIVGGAVIITLTLTLFASLVWGFTLNRVSLFALIFSIGILVDDAIVVVENISRHMGLGSDRLTRIIPRAVDEVGGPTILATFTVIAALLPMAFVSGLMGPYMSPIPINASMGMVISLVVAFTMTPWLSRLLLRGHRHTAESSLDERLMSWSRTITGYFIADGRTGIRRRRMLLAAIFGLIFVSLALVGFKLVIMKMLPFDNKSEFQVIVDAPEGTSLEKTTRLLDEMAHALRQVPEVANLQIYAGTAAPINFNGLVRQYYLRRGSHLGDIQVNLLPKKQRQRKSHEIARAVRGTLQKIAAKYNADIKIAEPPPGPPVQAPLVAEVYGPDYQGQIELAKKIRRLFESTTDLTDVDDSIEHKENKLVIQVKQQKAALLGVSQQAIVQTLSAALRGDDATYLHAENKKYPYPVRLTFANADKADIKRLLQLKVRSRHGRLVALSDLVTVHSRQRQNAIYHKDLSPVVFVTGDMAGRLDSPLYGMFSVYAKLQTTPLAHGRPVEQFLLDQPAHPHRYGIKWDGEWQVTYETFRDMGLAYSVGLVLIYMLIVAQFRSYLVPLIIMAPIPLTVIGVLPGHALLGAKFTATSMIGMIALAGIIVRNSILLVDFINQQLADGGTLKDAVIRSVAVRAKPIALTGVAAMLGAFFILDDPIFSGLAISLIFGILVSTLLTLIVIPAVYYAYKSSPRFQ